MKRILALALAAVMTLGLTACGGGSKPASSAGNSGSSAAASTSQPAASGDATEISLWTYPIGGWGDEKQVNELTAAFQAATAFSFSDNSSSQSLFPAR